MKLSYVFLLSVNSYQKLLFFFFFYDYVFLINDDRHDGYYHSDWFPSSIWNQSQIPSVMQIRFGFDNSRFARYNLSKKLINSREFKRLVKI